MSANVAPPQLPLPPEEYSREYMDALLKILRLYFAQVKYAGPMQGSTLHLNLDTLPTAASLADLRLGDVYLDNTAGANVLKIKV